MSGLGAVYRREAASYFATPLAYVFIVIFLLLAGGFLAIGSCMSALTRNQVVAFILGVVACFLFLLAGFPLVLDAFRGWAPPALVDAIASLSFLTHFQAISKGVLDARDGLYFAMTIGVWLYATTLVLELRKAD